MAPPRQPAPVVSVADRYVNRAVVHYLVGACVVPWTWDAARLLVAPDPHVLVPAWTGAVGGWLLADALSYLVHLVIDSAAYERWLTRGHTAPIATIIDTHHSHPLNYSQLSDVELVAVTYPATLPVLAVWWVAGQDAAAAWVVALRAAMMAFGLLAGHAHKWAHERGCGMRVPAAVRALQDAGVLLPAAAHREHHRTFDRQYSLVSGATQPVLDAIVFAWRRRFGGGGGGGRLTCLDATASTTAPATTPAPAAPPRPPSPAAGAPRS